MNAKATTRAEYEAAFEKLKSFPLAGEHQIGDLVLQCSLKQWAMHDAHGNRYGGRTGNSNRMRDGIRVACHKWLNAKFR